LSIPASQKEVQELKEAVEVGNLKEQMIAHILMEQGETDEIRKKCVKFLSPKGRIRRGSRYGSQYRI
jgi:hypothetical protein